MKPVLLSCLLGLGLMTAMPALHAAPLTLPEAWAKVSRQERLTVARHYFDVIVADREYAATNERMSMEYVAFDRNRVSPDAALDARIASREQELRYLVAREARSSARLRQQLSRHALMQATKAATPPGELDEDAISDVIRSLPERLPGLEKLKQRLPAGTPEHELVAVLAEIDHLRRAVLPRLAKEDELAQLKLDKAREELAAGRKSELGAAMVMSSDVAFRQVRAEADLALAVIRLEAILDTPVSALAAD